MKKQQKVKEQKKPPKKPLSFDQRFKDKKNIVGKLGVLDLLGLHQPFDLDRQPTPLLQERIVETAQKQEKDKNPQKQTPKSKMNESQNLNAKRRASDPHLRTNKTQSLKNTPKGLKNQKQKSYLPRISKSTANIIQVDLSNNNNKPQLSTRQYWRGKNSKIYNNKRANSQLSCINMIKADYEANYHFENLAKFQKINKNKRKSLKIQNI